MRPDTLTVLVVDDEAEVRSVVGRTLAKLGIRRVEEARDGVEALCLLGAASPAVDVVICDLQMPGGDGVGLMGALAARGTSVPLILMSGAGEPELKAAAQVGIGLGLRIAACLVKPIATRALDSALLAALAPGTGLSTRPDRSPAPADSIPKEAVIDFAHRASGPLMTVTMLSELLLSDGGLTPAQAKDVESISRAAAELSRMIKEFRG